MKFTIIFKGTFSKLQFDKNKSLHINTNEHGCAFRKIYFLSCLIEINVHNSRTFMWTLPFVFKHEKSTHIQQKSKYILLIRVLE